MPNPSRLRVVAADNTSMGTQLLVDALARDPQLEMIESPPSAAALLGLVRSEKPHVAIVSARLGETNGGSCTVIREIRSHAPATRTIVLLDASERSAVVEAFRAGAHGVFSRAESFRVLGKCIQCVHRGQVWASSQELHFLLEALGRPALALHSNGRKLLSAREMDVVRCLTEGLTNREAAERLSLTEHTVKNYLFRIFDKLGVSSRLEVVLYALGNHVPRAAALMQPVRSVAAPPTLRKVTS